MLVILRTLILIFIVCGRKSFAENKYNIYQYMFIYFRNVKHNTGSYVGFLSVSPSKLVTKNDIKSFLGLDSYHSKTGFQKSLGMISMVILHPLRLLLLIVMCVGISAVMVALYIVVLDLIGYIPFSTLAQIGIILTAIGSLYVFIKKEPKWYPLIILACVVYSITLLIYEPDFYFSTFSKARYYFHPEQAKEAVNIWAYVMVFIFYLSSLELLRIFISMTYFSWARKRFMRKHPNLYTGVENNEVKNNAPDLPITEGELSTNATS